MQEVEVIRCMQLPLAQDWLLVPNVTVAEVISYVAPKVINDQDVYFGDIDWRGVKVPIISFEKACGLVQSDNNLRDRIAILYHPDGDEEYPYIGIKLTDIPKSFRAVEDNLITEEIELDNQTAIKFQLSYDDQRLFIPNFDTLFSFLS